MKRDGHTKTTFFVGPEVEQTPAYGKKTLFVVGWQETKTVLEHARAEKVAHVFLGANHSFDTTYVTDYLAKTTSDQIVELLGAGFMVTLDYQAHQHDKVLAMLAPEVWQSRQFVPLLSVRIPHVGTSSINLTVKIDDIDFKATNPGVWCLHHNQIMDSNRFTDWKEYESDNVIATEEDPILHEPVGEGEPDHVPPTGEIPNAVTQSAMKEARDMAKKADTELPNEERNDTVTDPVDPTLGLDIKPTTALKADPEEVAKPVVSATPETAAAAYAEGTKADPLSAPATKKVTSKK